MPPRYAFAAAIRLATYAAPKMAPVLTRRAMQPLLSMMAIESERHLPDDAITRCAASRCRRAHTSDEFVVYLLEPPHDDVYRFYCLRLFV